MENEKRILLTGATGFIGTLLRDQLLKEGHLLTIVTRNPLRIRGEQAKNQKFISWEKESLLEGVRDQDVVIHLAGESIAGKRWNDDTKKKIYDSRIQTTRKLVQAFQSVGKDQRPALFISASAVGIYGDQGDTVLPESAAQGSDFLSRVCIDWEAEARKAEDLGIRVAIPRIGIVLGEGGGVLDKMLLAFKLFAGGPIGSGKQYLPWIHIQDVCRGLRFPMEKESLSGPYNLCAPEPVTMKEFASAMGRVMHRPSSLKVPTWALKLGLGEAAEPVTASLRAVPEVLASQGFEFEYSDLEEALADLI